MGKKYHKSLSFHPSTVWKELPAPYFIPRARQVLSVPPSVKSGAKHNTSPSCVLSTLGKVVRVTAVFCVTNLNYQEKCKEILQDLSRSQQEYVVVSRCYSLILRFDGYLRAVWRSIFQ